MKTLRNFAILLVIYSCSTSDITSSWHAKEAPQQFDKIVVMGLISNNERSLQEKMEAHIVGDLRTLGYHATSSIETYGPKYFNGMDEKTALSRLGADGIDAVLTIVLLDREREKYYVPGRIYYSPYGNYQNRFWHYHGVLSNRIYEPGYYVENTVYFWETNLYRMSDQKLLYSAQSKSFEPNSTENLAHQYGRNIIKDMVKNDVLKK